MGNIHFSSTGNKIRPKKKSPDRAMANTGATIIGQQGTGMGPIYALPLVHQTGGGKYSTQNMHLLQVVAECTLVHQVRFCVARLGLCPRIGVKLISGAQLRY